MGCDLLTQLGYRGRWATIVVVAAVVLAACGSSPGEPTTPPRSSLTMHVVDQRIGLPCPDDPPEGLRAFVGTVEPGGDETCVLVELALVTLEDIADVTRLQDSGGDAVVDLELSSAGHEKLLAAARRSVGRRLAIVVENRVVSAPLIQTTELSATIRVAGVSAAAATRLVRFLADDASPPSEGSSSHGRVAKAEELCLRLAEREGFPAESASSRPMTAGEVVSSLQTLDANTSPWDALAADHFVASCSFPILDEFPTNTTTCPDGTIGVLDQPEQFYVDENERQSRDPVADILQHEPCV